MNKDQLTRFGTKHLQARPLLFLLPFFIFGLTLGPHFIHLTKYLWFAASILALTFIFWTWRAYAYPLAAGALVFLVIGMAYSAERFSPPGAANHVYHFQNQRGLIFGGRVSEPARISFGRTRLVIAANEMLRPGGKPEPVKGKIYLTIPGELKAIRHGDRVRFPVTLKPFNNFANPGAFDYQAFWAAQGVWVQGFQKEPRLIVRLEGPGSTISFARTVDSARKSAGAFIDSAIGQPAQGLIKAMLIGVRHEVEPGVKDAFTRLGLAHLMAISGLHIGLIAYLCYRLILKLCLIFPGLALRLNVRSLSAVLALIPVFLYASLAGPRPSTVRAALMVVVFCLAIVLGRRRDYFSAWALAAWAILVVQPGAIFVVSFQLTFSATLFILLMLSRMERPFQADEEADPSAKPGRPVMDTAAGPVLMSIAAFLGTAPIIAYHFNHFSLLTLPANMLLTPIITLLVIPPGLAALAIMPVFPWLSGVMFKVIEQILWVPLNVIENVGSLTWVNPLVPSPGILIFLIYFSAFGVLFLIRPLKKAVVTAGIIVLAGAIIFAGASIFDPGKNQLRVTFLDVGHGSAAHLSLPNGTQIIVDGGGFPRSSFDTGENLIAPYLLKQNVTRLDALVMSHPHLDHMKGLFFLARHFKPKEFWSNQAPVRTREHRKLMGLVDESGILKVPLKTLLEGRMFGRVKIEALYPPDDQRPSGRYRTRKFENDNSLVLKISFNKISFLLPGDLETDGEARLVALAKDALRADVLLAPHHGGRTSCSDIFLNAVKPKHVVFSVGGLNRPAHPNPESLARVLKLKPAIYKTSRDGAITFITDGESLTVSTVID